MPLNLLNRGKVVFITVKYACSHIYKIKCHPDTSDEQRAEIAAHEATLLCAACRTGQAVAARNRRRR